jgi:hypothetical protein
MTFSSIPIEPAARRIARRMTELTLVIVGAVGRGITLTILSARYDGMLGTRAWPEFEPTSVRSMRRRKQRGLFLSLLAIVGVFATAWRGGARERIGQIALDWLIDDE